MCSLSDQICRKMFRIKSKILMIPDLDRQNSMALMHLSCVFVIILTITLHWKWWWYGWWCLHKGALAHLITRPDIIAPCRTHPPPDTRCSSPNIQILPWCHLMSLKYRLPINTPPDTRCSSPNILIGPWCHLMSLKYHPNIVFPYTPHQIPDGLHQISK